MPTPFVLLLVLAPLETSPEERALAALAKEVTPWRTEHRCCSCHHNADGVRALYRARAAGMKLPEDRVSETTRWLARPEGWDNNGGDGPFNDREQAALQFANALAVAVETGHLKDTAPLRVAARRVAGLQQDDGSWKSDNDEAPGAPASHGRPLATSLALYTLRQADPKAHAEAIAKGERWLRTLRVENVYQAASVLLGLGTVTDEAGRKQRDHCLDLIRRGEARTGGWGPYVGRATEPFDTALVLLALTLQEPTRDRQALILRGRAALIRWQEKDGTWPPTTRPAGSESNAQRTATTAWALWALLRTR